MIPTHGQARQKAEELKEFLGSRLAGTYPRKEAREFALLYGEERESFLAHLDTFHSTIAGYCSSGNRWLQAEEKRIADCRKQLARPFFERYPQYRRFETQLTEFPDLAEVMGLYEAARKRLIALMTTIEQVKKR